MRMASMVFVGSTLLALTPVLATAQEKIVHVNVGGGPTFNLGDLGTRFGTGWGPAVGITLDAPGGRFALQVEYAYRWFDIKDSAPLASVSALSANHKTHQLDFNLVANLTPPESPIRGYVVGGPGAYYRSVEITRYEGSGIVCDPFFYVCGSYPVTSVLGSRGGWDMGFNVGAGVGLRLGDASEFFIESRYHYMAGPKITSATQLPAGAAASSSSTNGSYTPLTFGFRF